jgi:hypothetical protein
LCHTPRRLINHLWELQGNRLRIHHFVALVVALVDTIRLGTV